MKFTLLTLTALAFAIASVALLYDVADPLRGVLAISVCIAIDAAFVLAVGVGVLERLVVRPLRDTVAAAERIAAGDVGVQVEMRGARELRALASSVNQMADRLRTEQVQLARAEKLASVGRLAAGVAHEIGTPLGVLGRHVGVLRALTAGEAVATEAVSGAEHEMARIDRIVGGLLEYSRPRRPMPTPIDVNDTLRRVVDLLGTQGHLRRVSLIMELANEGPFVYGETHELEQVLVSLLLNAADAVAHTGVVAIRTTCMPADMLEEGAMRRSSDPVLTLQPHLPEPHVRRWLGRGMRPSWCVKIVVADSGPGMSDEEAEHLFDPFRPATKGGRGGGVGLAVVSRAVESLEGMIWVQRAREGGAAFHLLFPLAEASFALDEPTAIPMEWRA